MKVSDYNLILILTGMILGLIGQFFNNMNVVSLGLIVFLYSLYRMYLKPRWKDFCNSINFKYFTIYKKKIGY